MVRFVVLAGLLLSCGCASNNKGKIEGTRWRSLAATVKGQSLPDGFLNLEFGKDGKLVYRGGGQTYTGTYSLGMANSVTMHLDQDLAGRRTHVETIVVNGDRLTMRDPDGTEVKFERRD
jgi:hypothetical protein